MRQVCTGCLISERDVLRLHIDILPQFFLLVLLCSASLLYVVLQVLIIRPDDKVCQAVFGFLSACWYIRYCQLVRRNVAN